MRDHAQADRFALWPLVPGVALCLAFCWMARLEVIGSEGVGMGALMMLIAAFALPVILSWLAVSIWQAVKAIRQKRWRRTISMLSCPAMILAALPIAAVYNLAADYVEVRRALPTLDSQISEARQNGQHKASILLDLLNESQRELVWDDRYLAGRDPADQPAGWQSDYRNCAITPLKEQIFVSSCPL